MGVVCGGVCADTWTEDMSVALCKSKKCGDRVLKPFSQPTPKAIIVKSLHAINKVTDLNRYTYVKNMDNDKSCEQKPAYVVCSGNNMSFCSASIANQISNPVVPFVRVIYLIILLQAALSPDLHLPEASVLAT